MDDPQFRSGPADVWALRDEAFPVTPRSPDREQGPQLSSIEVVTDEHGAFLHCMTCGVTHTLYQWSPLSVAHVVFAASGHACLGATDA